MASLMASLMDMAMDMGMVTAIPRMRKNKAIGGSFGKNCINGVEISN